MSARLPAWTDTHCHLQLLDLPDAEVVAEAEAAGVARLVCVGIDLSTSEAAVAAAGAFQPVCATVGLHPHEARRLDAQWEGLLSLLESPGVVAVGECGLDFHRNHSPREDQEAAFRRQIALARERRLALVVHTRDAWDATFEILDEEGCPERTVFHCFSGGVEEARRCVESYGAFLSIAGPISYPKNEMLREAARSVPLDRLVVETDAPFLSPQGFRGKPNHPARVALVGEALAEALGRGVEEVSLATTRNAAELFSPAR